jgi:hypothetical protein
MLSTDGYGRQPADDEALFLIVHRLSLEGVVRLLNEIDDSKKPEYRQGRVQILKAETNNNEPSQWQLSEKQTSRPSPWKLRQMSSGKTGRAASQQGKGAANAQEQTLKTGSAWRFLKAATVNLFRAMAH